MPIPAVIKLQDEIIQLSQQLRSSVGEKDEIISEIKGLKSDLIQEFQAIRADAIKNADGRGSVPLTIFESQKSCSSAVPAWSSSAATPPSPKSAKRENGRMERPSYQSSKSDFEEIDVARCNKSVLDEVRQRIARQSGDRDTTATVDFKTMPTKRGVGAFFGALDCETIKDKVRHGKLKRKVYDVKSQYFETGIAQAIARHVYFEHVTLIVIVLNAFWMSIDTDLNEAAKFTRSETTFVVADVVFFTYFLCEWIIRFAAFSSKLTCFRDGWFMFDSALVFLYAIDPFLLGVVDLCGGGILDLDTAVLRLFRLARLTRLTRLLRSFPELMIMIKGMITALATVGYTLGLLGIVTYVFAIAIRNLVPSDSRIEKELFPDVWETMHNLVIYGTFMDSLSSFIHRVKKDSIPCLILAWVYIAIAAMLVMNMLIGILCEVVAAVATEEKETLNVDRVKNKFTALLHDSDSDGDGWLSWEEFACMLEEDECQVALRMCDVDLDALIDMAEDLFCYQNGAKEVIKVSHNQFIELVLNLRGSQAASVKDVMAIGKRLNAKFGEVNAWFEFIASYMAASGSDCVMSETSPALAA